MTGIERLRTIAGSWDAYGLGGALGDVARQIERERACDADIIENVRLIVGGVIDEMERHILGHEGMDDSPVARWARELREALGGEGHDSAADVSMSAYDLLPQEERDAIAWVRGHGGLDAVKARWEGCVPASWLEKAKRRYERKRDNLKAHAWELEHKCAERRERIRELERNLAKSASDQLKADSALYDLSREVRDVCKAHGIDPGEDPLGALDDALDSRLMPEGMGWLVEAWPKVDGKPVDFVTGYEPSLGVLEAVSIYSNGACEVMGHDGIIESVKDIHIAKPKVLDADGVEIDVGDDLYSVEGSLKFHVSHIDRVNGKIATDAMFSLDKWADSAMYTHRAPVLAADGRPLREGETVWYRDHIDPLEVRGISTTESGAQYVKAYNDYEGEVSAPARCFSHERTDSLDRLAEDIGAMVVAWRSNRDLFDAQEAAAGCVGENTLGAALDSLVRRAKALAERDA